MSSIATFIDGTLTVTTEHGTETISVQDISHNWNALSHFPERRASMELGALAERLNSFADHVQGLIEMGGRLDAVSEVTEFASRQISLTRRSWALESRCMSAFIVGPAKFPTERNRKRMNSADKGQELIREHLTKAKRAVERRAFPHGMPGDAIRANNPDAPELIREKIERLRANHSRMKAVNAAIRSVKSGDEAEMIEAVIDVTGFTRATAAKIVCPIEAWMGRGFPGYMLSGELAEIKRLEGRLKSIERNRERGEVERMAETTAGPLRIVENGDAARVQLFFEGKPTAGVRDALKSNGFRWAPSEGAWQRHLNENGRWAVERVLKALEPVSA
ncbi:hypothetical protein [Pleomorphomonas sp. JP5]|uniref:hypothetical protein n=1 Tax=Pleomorphomonas sp. JP5 TaxID=2942998 RepID=UPI00204391CE|nr:hypothetical protein [Pleomorphomonas sp. JP5]MCM5558498.1 hypothetical protein [Pleomorphomonas sp. JP5]